MQQHGDTKIVQTQWKIFIDILASEKNLSDGLKLLLLCLPEPGENVSGSLNNYVLQSIRKFNSNFGEESFRKDKNELFRIFQIDRDASGKVINNDKNKLDKLRKFLVEKYQKYENQAGIFSTVGLSKIHDKFPLEDFKIQIKNLIVLSEDLDFQYQSEEGIDILQTFAPNLPDLRELLASSIEKNIKVRVLLAWPKSEIVRIREKALKKYIGIQPDFNIENEVLKNLELLENILKSLGGDSYNLELKLYDSIPSMAIYRVNKYALVGFFIHNKLAIDSFQLELDLNASNKFMSNDITNNFLTIWDMSRDFLPQLKNPHWRSDLAVLFKD